jgi:hypothetical protein
MKDRYVRSKMQINNGESVQGRVSWPVESSERNASMERHGAIPIGLRGVLATTQQAQQASQRWEIWISGTTTSNTPAHPSTPPHQNPPARRMDQGSARGLRRLALFLHSLLGVAELTFPPRDYSTSRRCLRSDYRSRSVLAALVQQTGKVRQLSVVVLGQVCAVCLGKRRAKLIKFHVVRLSRIAS